MASLALLGSGAAVTSSPAQSAPADDCSPVYPLSTAPLTDGQSVTTLTVTKGTTPEPFSGEYLGKINDGIAPGVDMLMFDFASPEGTPANEIDKKGIWAGMSGSPVYTEDGELIGAVAYGLGLGDDEETAVAGVTPYEAMAEYMTSPAAAAPRIQVSQGSARAIAEDADVTARQASGASFGHLPMPMSLAGLSPLRNFAQVKKDAPKYLHKGVRATRAGGASSSTAAGPEHLVPGGNLGAAISHGTVTFGGVGTVTNVCDGRLIGFGHPMTWGGRTTLGMMPAEAVTVQDDAFVSFKIANMGEPAGIIDQDRLTGISGLLGEGPVGTAVSSTVAYGARTKDGDSTSLVQDWNADVTFSQALTMHDVAIDAIQPGSATTSLQIVGTHDGNDFQIDTADRFTSGGDIAFESIWSTADLVYALSRLDDVKTETITTGSKVTDSTDTSRLGKLQQKRRGTWVTIGRRKPAVVAPGRTLTLRFELRRSDGSDRMMIQRLRVPRKARGEGSLGVTGGAWTWNDDLWEADTFEEVKKAVKNDVRNDQVETRLSFWSRRSETTRRVVSAPQQLVVEGDRWASVVVRR